MPTVAYCLASAPRSGSTLLAGALWSTGRLGWPEEYLRPGDERRWSVAWGLDPDGPSGGEGYLSAMLRYAATPNGVSGFKLFASHALVMDVDALEEAIAQYPGIELRLVHLRRRDLVAAAVSEWKAQVTGQWVRLQGQAARNPGRPPRPGEITKYHEHQHAWDRFWLGARADGIPWMELWYDELEHDLAGAVRSVADFLGVDGAKCTEVRRPERQRGTDERRWMEAWVDATGGCVECGYS